MEGTRVQVVNEVKKDFPNGDALCLQWCRYLHADGDMEIGYRFIWRNDHNHLMAHRGQARIPSLALARELMSEAEQAGWGSYESKRDFEK